MLMISFICSCPSWFSLALCYQSSILTYLNKLVKNLVIIYVHMQVDVSAWWSLKLDWWIEIAGAELSEELRQRNAPFRFLIVGPLCCRYPLSSFLSENMQNKNNKHYWTAYIACKCKCSKYNLLYQLIRGWHNQMFSELYASQRQIT